MLFVLIAASVAESLVDIINNNPASTWRACEYPPSVLPKARILSTLSPVDTPQFVELETSIDRDFPDEYDAREDYGSLLSPVRNGSACAAGWAFSVAISFGNRMEIMGCGYGHLSAQDLISCDLSNYGCSGGYIDRAWQWTKNYGITTDDCMPFTSGNGVTGPCPSLCSNGSAITRHKITSFKQTNAYGVYDTVLNYGSIQAGFTVYQDFLIYQSGIYIHQAGGIAGNHYVVILGWGWEDGVPFWICQNCWGTGWGEGGYFRFLRGSNHCLIESNAAEIVHGC